MNQSESVEIWLLMFAMFLNGMSAGGLLALWYWSKTDTWN